MRTKANQIKAKLKELIKGRARKAKADIAYIRLCQALLRDIEAEELKQRANRFYQNIQGD